QSDSAWRLYFFLLFTRSSRRHQSMCDGSLARAHRICVDVPRLIAMQNVAASVLAVVARLCQGKRAVGEWLVGLRQPFGRPRKKPLLERAGGLAVSRGVSRLGARSHVLS